MAIPKQLQNPAFRFVLLGQWNKWKNLKTGNIEQKNPIDYKKLNEDKNWKPLGKTPFETGWQNKGYSFDDTKLLQHIEKGLNYGIIGGYGNLRIADADTEEFSKAIRKLIGNTFTDLTGSGLTHTYILSDYNTNHVFAGSVGELRANNYQAVCPGCKHPNGNYYKILDDSPIKFIPKDELLEILKPFLREENNAATTTETTKVMADKSRSGREWMEVCRLIQLGYTKEQIYEKMMAFAKWASAPKQYKEMTYAKALKQKKEGVQEQIEEPTSAELELLKDPQLLERFNEQFGKRIVNEKLARTSIFLNACGKFVKNNQTASYNLCCNSESGAGKDFVMNNVLRIFPKNVIESRSRISPTAFTYWHNARYEPNWTWDSKICSLIDISNNVLNSPVFKLMCSDETKSTITINNQAVDIEIKGKPVIFITIASADPFNEMLRRMPMLMLDESKKQTKAIMEKQAELAEKGITPEYDPLFTSALSKLERVKVKIPFTKKLVDVFPNAHIIMRTHFYRLLDYIKACAALYQYQREVDDEGYVIATTEDYDNATIPLEVTTSNPLMIPLTRKQKKILEECKQLLVFSVRELEPQCPFITQKNLYIALAKLQEFGFLTSFYDDHDEKVKPKRMYQYQEFELKHIPKWSEINAE